MTSLETTKKLQNMIASLKSQKERREYLIKDIEQSEKKITELNATKAAYQKASELVFAFMEQGRERSKSIFEITGSSALGLIFGAGHKLEIEYGQRGNTSIATMRALLPAAEGLHLPVPLTQKGGGYNDVVSAAFAIAQLEIIQPRLEGPLIADETFKHLDAERQPKAGQMLRGTLNPDNEGAEGEGRQLIFNTHSKHFLPYADKIIYVEMLYPDLISIVSDITPEDTEDDDGSRD
jgi:predicted ATP-dependent endonuclease of OLD family